MNRLESRVIIDRLKKILPIVKGIKIIGNFFVIALCIITLFMMISLISSRYKKEPPSFMGYKFYAVLSQSMNPVFDMGSLVAVKSVNPDDLKVGDIITFNNISQTGDTTTHRIVDIKNDGELSFITKGDANNVNDSDLVSAKNVIGKLHFYIPYIGKFLSFIKSRIGIITLIVIPSFFIGITEIIKLLGYISESRKSKQEIQLNESKE